MLTDNNYIKILKLLDRYLWDNKVSETNFNYVGLILDWHFTSSVLSIDYMDIYDYFEDNGDFKFNDTAHLHEQYKNFEIKDRLRILENILTILSNSTENKPENTKIINRIVEILKRDFVKVTKDNGNHIDVVQDDVIDSGSYCNIIRVNECVLRKELRDEYKNDEKLSKRLKYEYENMKKLSDCPQILKVYQYDIDNNTYTMEQGEINLYDYLKTVQHITFNEQVKIIKDIIKGIVFAYKNSIIHRDLHLGNILKIGGDFVICDFGLSKDLSLERSMKSSYTEKNNHIFVDPYAMDDFTKLDHKSDIYSFGKIMDYIFTYTNSDSRPFKAIIERCTCRDRELRYDLAEDVLKDIDMVLDIENMKNENENIINNIKNGTFNVKVHEFILNKVNNQEIGKFIVDYDLSEFGVIILKFENMYQMKILNAINNEFVQATGFGGWENYDIFADIAYYLYKNSVDIKIKNLSKNILDTCAEYRHYALNLLNNLN